MSPHRKPLSLLIMMMLLLAACSKNESVAPEVAQFDDMYTAGIAWMDHLKTCEPYTQSYLIALLQTEQVNTISGKEGDLCVMSMRTTDRYTIDCKLNADGIKTLTRSELYTQMKSQIPSSDDASMAVLSSQCQITMLTPQP